MTPPWSPVSGARCGRGESLTGAGRGEGMTPVPGALRGRMSEADYQGHEERGGLPGARSQLWTTRGTKPKKRLSVFTRVEAAKSFSSASPGKSDLAVDHRGTACTISETQFLKTEAPEAVTG